MDTMEVQEIKTKAPYLHQSHQDHTLHSPIANSYILDFSCIGMNDTPIVGGKNASLGELINHLSQSGVRVPGGFATTAQAFSDFLTSNNIKNIIDDKLLNLDAQNVSELSKTGKEIRDLFKNAKLPQKLVQEITEGYQKLKNEKGSKHLSIAVRSSATAEDLPEASFAGQQETFINISGIENILEAVKKVYASLYNDRAISYRVHQGFAHSDVSISVGIQCMVAATASGVMFSIDTESGFDDVVFITSIYGLGELIVQGSVNPDEFYVYKKNLNEKKPAVIRRRLGNQNKKMVYSNSNEPGKSVAIVNLETHLKNKFSLSDPEVEELARYALAIEKHYGRPMDIEWAKDGHNGKIYILQARPETVQSNKKEQVIRRYEIRSTNKTILAQGRAIGQKVGQGVARIVNHISEISKVGQNDVLITDMTDPDWEPIMKHAAAIVTNRGGRTCHAAIIAREMGIPAIVGCGNATETIKNGEEITISCAEGDTGFVYQGKADFTIKELDIKEMPSIPIKIMMNIANPDLAFAASRLPNHGIGLARLEFIINNMIGIHPRALIEFDSLKEPVKTKIAEKIAAYPTPTEFYIQKLTEGIAMLACAFKDHPVIVRTSDFKTNEYANLLGGKKYEPTEENPMIGFRGASRYTSKEFIECFALECEALTRVRDVYGFTNVQVMIPFVRTLPEARSIIGLLKQHGLERGKNGLKIIMMCEVPSNAILAEKFLEYFDGFSIGSNDLTQLTLGLDRDSALISEHFDERNEAVKALMQKAIQTCKSQNKYIGICGQGPSDHPDLAQWLIEQDIDSVSLNPDTVLETWLFLAKHSREYVN